MEQNTTQEINTQHSSSAAMPIRHIFIINPCAGKQNCTSAVTSKVAQYAASHPDFDHLIYVTQAPGDATQYVRRFCEQHPDETLRFYACGGDGTLNEVVSGLVGQPNAQVTVVASGSGNDYIKYYATHADFNDIARLVEGTPHPVDVMKIGDRYSINVCNLGFDAMVCKTGNDLRRKPIIGGKHAYTSGIIKCIFTSRSNYVRMSVDGEPFYDGYMLLCTLSNGQYVGGNYKCAPLSKNDDGLLEVSLFRRMSLLKFIRLIDDYSKGTHIHRPEVKRLMKYRQGTTVELASNEPFYLCIDGEMILGTHFRVQNLRHAVTFISPQNNEL